MRSNLRKMASPRSLLAFDAAARLGSFTLAAEELNMQQPSVSAAIKQLEEALGRQLFIRGHRKVQLTPAGERLYAGVDRGLTDIEQAIASIRQLDQSGYVTLNSSSAFSYYWMIPRLNDLHAQYPEIDLRMQTSDREPDLDVENIDLAIRLGDGNYPGYHSARIADEVIVPVASPAVVAAAKANGMAAIRDLAAERLIHLEEPIRVRPTWRQWFAHHGLEEVAPRAGLRFNDYAMVLQAAVSGEGFAFGWQHIVRNLVERGLLAAQSDWAWRTGNGIYLVWSATRTLSPQAANVRDWIVSVADQTQDRL
ncbi:MAG: LysR family transcriptional regulator [Rhizobiaceae bacterium]|nr:LysR family transcriptional regulator [Rhizobiaceae bacterium]